jgi:carbon monoxide dehydrogenase subunit G
MDIDRAAPAIAEGQIDIEAVPDVVWSVLSDLSAWPSWNPDVKSMAVDGPVEAGTTFRWKAGSASLTSTLRNVDPPREIGWTGTTMGIKAVHVFTFEPSDGGTRASSAESFRGLIPSVFRGYSRKILQRGIDSILTRLKAEAERRMDTTTS